MFKDQSGKKYKVEGDRDIFYFRKISLGVIWLQVLRMGRFGGGQESFWLEERGVEVVLVIRQQSESSNFD